MDVYLLISLLFQVLFNVFVIAQLSGRLRNAKRLVGCSNDRNWSCCVKGKTDRSSNFNRSINFNWSYNFDLSCNRDRDYNRDRSYIFFRFWVHLCSFLLIDLFFELNEFFQEFLWVFDVHHLWNEVSKILISIVNGFNEGIERKE